MHSARVTCILEGLIYYNLKVWCDKFENTLIKDRVSD